MVTLTIQLDEHTEAELRRLSKQEGNDPSQVAARLLTRAVPATRPRPHYDIESLKARYAEFAAEDADLAESGAAECAELLAHEDAA